MIVRVPHRPHPIPFENPLQSPGAGDIVLKPPVSLAGLGRLGMPPAPPPVQGHGSPTGQSAERQQRGFVSVEPSGGTAHAGPTPPARPGSHDTGAPMETKRRKVLARHDGTHGLSVRSANTGHHYRFEPNGGTLWVDAADAALLRRNPHITLL